MSIERIAICVCTHSRPMMLAACLESLATLVWSRAAFKIVIVVVDNETEPNNQGDVDGFKLRSPFPVAYVHEPRRGIAVARNAALDRSLELGADWIAMIDDDEIAHPDWLAQLMHHNYLDIPVLMGLNRQLLIHPAPFWARTAKEKGAEGDRLKTAYTGNVRFSAELSRAGLRFEERLGLMGGEDNEFFARAHAMGFEIRRTLRAVTYETAHEERLTYLAQMYRAYWCSASELRRLAITRGWLGAVLRKAHTIPLNLIFGTGWLFAALVVAPVNSVTFRDLALEGGKKMAKALGRAAAIIGFMPQPYRVIHGR